MKAVLHVGFSRKWTHSLGVVPWPLVPLGNRPLIDYWLELCVQYGIQDVRLILGDGAEHVENYVNDGAQWGLHVSYAFLRDDHRPVSFLQRTPEQWRDGLLFLSGPLFPRRLTNAGAARPDENGFYFQEDEGGGLCAICRRADELVAFCSGAPGASRVRTFEELGLALDPIESTKEFFTINMRLAEGEMSRYLAPGYGAADGSCVGFNVIIPLSAEIAPSVIIGNDCRIGPMVSVGHGTVIGNRVVVDRQAELARCVILDGTYIGKQVEIHDKIVVAGRVIDPDEGIILELKDTWLLAKVAPLLQTKDKCCAVGGWLLAVLLFCLQVPPFLVLYGLIHWLGLGSFKRQLFHGVHLRMSRIAVFHPTVALSSSVLIRLFYALSLDLTPRMGGAALGRWLLCGQEPLRVPEDNALRGELAGYFPGVFSYATALCHDDKPPVIIAMNARYYAHCRSVRENARILRVAFANRLALLFKKIEPSV